MAEKTEKPTTNKEPGYYCEICRCRVSRAEADRISYSHCGRKMTEMEVIYMSDPSPSGP